MFKLWNELRPKANEVLKPNLGLRDWNELSVEEKNIIWKHIDVFFFNQEGESIDKMFCYGDYEEQKNAQNRVFNSIASLNENSRAKNFTKKFLENWNLISASEDFFRIFIQEDENVVFQLLSFYAKELIAEREKREPYKNAGEEEKEFEKRTRKWRMEYFDLFESRINEVFGDFGVSVMLTRLGFMSKQIDKITDEVYEPVLEFLSDSVWKEVSDNFRESFKEYQEKRYSNSITNTVSAIQAYLQILIYGKVGKGDISKLILQAQEKNLIPKDSFSSLMFKNMESIFAVERQEGGIAHPKLKDPTENNARTLINLAMIFLQHCITGDKKE